MIPDSDKVYRPSGQDQVIMFYTGSQIFLTMEESIHKQVQEKDIIGRAIALQVIIECLFSSMAL